MAPNKSIDTRTFLSRQVEPSEISKDSNNEASAPLSEAVKPWWMELLHNWTNHQMLVLCSSGLLLVPVAAKFSPYLGNLPQTPAQHQIVSRADYELLELGITPTDAQAMLGRAIEVSRSETTATYKWTNKDGSEITAIFEGNQLVSKEQLGLR